MIDLAQKGHVTIEGHEIQVSVADIAATLNVPCDDPVDLFGEYPSDVALHIIEDVWR